ncbi:DUF3329 domain-containing protein [Limosilactobacillus allomucosae]|uniref:DUF6056 family protein n=1 Tax=Limosilactobacillus allomucosae TaxID=3142938 RepID=A0ABV0I670_9LACO
MNKKELVKKFNQDKIISLVYLFVFIGISAWTLYTPLMGDDLFMVTKSVKGIISEGVREYFQWNGRFFGQFFARLLVLNNGIVAAIMNGFCFTLLTFFINKLSGLSSRSTLSKTLWMTLLTISFIPEFGETVMWRAGAGNYLWMTTICLAYLYFLQRVSFNKEKLLSRIILFILGGGLALISGWSNENTGLGIIIIAAVIIFINPHERVSILKIVLWLISIVGYLFLLKAPGNRIRLGAEANIPVIKRVITNIAISNQDFWSYSVTVILTIMFCCLFSVKYIFGGRNNIAEISKTIAYFISGYVVIYMLAAAPGTSGTHRAYFSGVIFMIIAIGRCVPEDLSKSLKQQDNKMIRMVVLLSLIFSVCKISTGMIDALCTDHAYRQRYALIEKKIRKGKKQVISIPKLSYTPVTEYSLHWEITNDPNAYPNLLYQHYFKIKGVTLRE